jgi:LssY-like putative type I secretion system component LssY
MKTCLNLRLLVLGVALFWCVPQRALAQETSPPPAPSAASSTNATAYQFDMDATKEWIDTKVDLRQDEKIRLTATGTITYPADKKHSDGRTFGPEGLARGFEDLIHEYAVPNSGHGSLIARLGSDDGAQAFAVGKSLEYEAPVGGRLFLGINQSMKDAAAATGNFQVKMEIIRPGLSTSAAIAAGGPPETPVSFITPAILSKIPRRISDHEGNPGDMVNIFIIGNQAELEKVFSAAGWVHVDSTVQNTVMNALVDSFEKKDYLTMPMSILYLFDRPQDYGFAHAEPVRVAMSRNHLRAWKSPYIVDGRILWCIAATHDVGFERDQRNNGLTHKIDPSIDGEREYVNDTLSETGLVVQRAHVTPSNPLLTAKTATGGEFHSDGRILVLVLKAKTPSAAN